MELTKGDKLKIKILKQLAIEKEGIPLNTLKKKIKAVNYDSVKRSCLFLSKVGLIDIKSKEFAGRNYNFISLSKLGEKIEVN